MLCVKMLGSSLDEIEFDSSKLIGGVFVVPASSDCIVQGRGLSFHSAASHVRKR